MILSSHYVLTDILHTLKRKDVEEIRKICGKYTSRYRNDKELTEICNLVSKELDEITRNNLTEMESRLEGLVCTRRLDNSGGTALWYTDRRRLNR
jgi:hypothetical protein